MIEIDFDVATDEKIEIAVVVIIQKSGASAEVRPVFPIGMIGQSRRRCDIDKAPASFAVASIMVKDVGFAVASYEDVGKAVVVDVANGYALATADMSQSNLGGHIPKPAAPEVLVQLA